MARSSTRRHENFKLGMGRSFMPGSRKRRLPARADAAKPGRLGTTTRSVLGRARRFGRGMRVRLRLLRHRRGLVPGMLSIVVPAYGVERFIDQCLHSLREQTYGNLEIIVVDDASPDRSAERARVHARRDPRVRVVSRPNGGLSAARNTGVAAARGEFLTFVDSDDLVKTSAYKYVIGALRESGSDFAVSLYDRLFRTRRRGAAPWIRSAHAQRRLRCTLEEFPQIQVNAVAWSKVYRREFWDRAGLTFPEGVLYEDQPVSSAAYAQARTFDVLPEISVSWRIRDDQSSISQQAGSVSNLRAQMVATDNSLRALEDAGKSDAAEARAIQLATYNLPLFTRHALTGDDEFFELLRRSISDLRQRMHDDAYAHAVNAQHKVLNELIMQDRQEDARAFIGGRRLEIAQSKTSVTDEGIAVDFDLPAIADLPADRFLLADAQLVLETEVVRTYWAGGQLLVDGYAYIRNIDLAANDPVVSVALVSGSGDRIPLRVEPHPSAQVDERAAQQFCDYRRGGFLAHLSAGDVPVGSQTWTFEVTVDVARVARTGALRRMSKDNSAVVPQTLLTESGTILTAALAARGVLTLTVNSVAIAARDYSFDDQGSELTVAFEADDARSVKLVSVTDAPRTVASTQPARRGDGSWTATLRLPAVATALVPGARFLASKKAYQVVVKDGSGRSRRIAARVGAPVGSTDRLAALDLRTDADGHLMLLRRDVGASVTAIVVEGPRVRATIATRGLAGESVRPVLHTPKHVVEGTILSEHDGRYDVEFDLVGTRWGYADLVAPAGGYALLLRVGDNVSVHPTAADSLQPQLPYDVLSERTRVVVTMAETRDLLVTIKPPLNADERGARNQRRLRAAARVERAEDDSVFFRSLYGEVTNCNGRAVHHELRRRGSDLTLYWSIQDYSVPVPDDGIALVENSREWHRIIASSRYHMVNVHQLSWFTKPDNQVMIETMHGYPFKIMGHGWWDKGGFPKPQVINYDRRAREWDYFVSPATYATPLLTEAFLTPAGATPEILEIGYPRNDELSSPDAGTIRKRVREHLGIGEDQKVVMYAPTFRDYLSTNDMEAKPVDFFDAEAASSQLGDDFVILMRGHAFNARSKQRGGSDGRVIDVTDYPEINDLCLASDAAILDYSSLRFDYAITGKPMIFLIPDQAEYDRARGGVIDYAPTAPGPHVTTTRAIVRHLKSFDALVRECAPLIARFREDYVDLEDGHASERLVDAVFVPRGDA